LNSERVLRDRPGGRRWWAHFDFTRLNIGPIIVGNQIEDQLEILESAPLSGAN
jgi:hypothetical protein